MNQKPLSLTLGPLLFNWPAAASAAPIIKVAAITRLGFTPISAVTLTFSEVARMARPSLVRLTSSIRPIITSADRAITSRGPRGST